MRKLLLAGVALSILVAIPAIAEDSVLRSLPAEVQKNIEKVRAACRREAMGDDADQSSSSSSANRGRSVPSGDEGLEVFTVAGAQAVMVSNLELCGRCFKSANCSNPESYDLDICIRSGNTWKKALSTGAVRRVFLSTTELDDPPKFKALVLSVFSGNKDYPTHNVSGYPAWKQSCDAVVKWNGRKFTYKPL